MSLPSLERGERLCEAFEMFKVWAPKANLDFDAAVLLAVGVVEEEAVKLSYCIGCHCALLIEQPEPSRSLCSRCRKSSGTAQ